MVLNNRYKNNSHATALLNSIQKEGISEFKNKNYQLIERKRCVICNNSNFELLSEKDRYGLPYKVVICTDCGLVFANPYFTPESLIRFYNEDSPKIYRGLSDEAPEESHAHYFDKKVDIKGKSIFDFISEVYKTPHNMQIAEVGCSSGGILQYFKNNGNEVTGSDYGESYINFGRSKDLNLNIGDAKKLIEMGTKADILIYADVLEHIPDVETEIADMKEILNEDGVVYIALPSVKKPTDFLGQLQNAHVYYFTLNTLKNLMAKHGFELISGTEGIKALFKSTPSTAKFEIINDYDTIITHLAKEEIKRNKLIAKVKRSLLRTKTTILLTLARLKRKLS